MKAVHIFGLVLTIFMFVTTSAIAQSNAQFAANAISFSRFEVESGKLALEKAQHDATKFFASDVLREHENALKDLADAAEKDDVALPATLDAEYAQKLDALTAAPTGDFDQAYLSTQVSVHEEAKAMFDAYIKTGTAGSLLSYAEKRLGTLRTYSVRVHGLTSH